MSCKPLRGLGDRMTTEWRDEIKAIKAENAKLRAALEGGVRYLEACGYGSGKLIQEGEAEAQMLRSFKAALSCAERSKDE